MTKKTGFRLRLRVLFGNTFITDDVIRTIMLAGKKVTIKSDKRGESLSKTNWIVFDARGFTTEENAHVFGKQLRLIVEIASFCGHLGIDTGEDIATAWVNEKFIRASGGLKPNERIRPNFHGLAILPDDDNTYFFP
ncbi:MAG: hypothetical protein COB78_12580 [Hyphomicrobiales bacterium]|nr:MAG: hypothetical protein COB78_12580 [Hyphomicrobiales bacterium]